jgi:hypothetical protein
MHKRKLIESLRPLSREVSEKILMSVSSDIFEAIGTPRALAAYLMLKHGEYAQLVSLELDPNHYRDSSSFGDDYLVTKLLSKYPNFTHVDLDPKARAKSSFFEFEDMCRTTNIRFRKLEEDPSLWDPSMLRVFRLARRKIASVLRKPNLDRISHGFGWGPGATTAATGSHTSAYVKYAKRLDVTSNALIMGHCCINSIPAWVNCQLQTDEFPSVEASITRSLMTVVRGNEIVFVPKNAKTHRIIAKEPHVNSYLQKGFGTEIRRLLRVAAYVDLKDQTLNQRLAKRGSYEGTLATIDLSGASDTISYELVRYLLPADWFTLLDQIRSKQGLIREDKTWIHYQKFSSMGNGCTFELESLIFWALCKACLEVNGGEQTLNVYGDDIIVPTDHFESVAKVIDFAGFRINHSKSFSSGPFRESCGKDYFLGTDVRPIFLKEYISNAESLFRVANAIRRYGHRRNFCRGVDLRLLPAWLHVVSRIPHPFRDLLIPDGFGDLGLVVNFDEACPSLPRPQKECGWEGYFFKGLTRHPVKQVMKDRHAGYTATLSATGSMLQSGPRIRPTSDGWLITWPDGDRSPLLGHHDLRAMTFPKITRIHTHGWYDFGPWE